METEGRRSFPSALRSPSETHDQPTDRQCGCSWAPRWVKLLLPGYTELVSGVPKPSRAGHRVTREAGTELPDLRQSRTGPEMRCHSLHQAGVRGREGLLAGACLWPSRRGRRQSRLRLRRAECGGNAGCACERGTAGVHSGCGMEGGQGSCGTAHSTPPLWAHVWASPQVSLLTQRGAKRLLCRACPEASWRLSLVPKPAFPRAWGSL